MREVVIMEHFERTTRLLLEEFEQGDFDKVCESLGVTPSSLKSSEYSGTRTVLGDIANTGASGCANIRVSSPQTQVDKQQIVEEESTSTLVTELDTQPTNSTDDRLDAILKTGASAKDVALAINVTLGSRHISPFPEYQNKQYSDKEIDAAKAMIQMCQGLTPSARRAANAGTLWPPRSLDN